MTAAAELPREVITLLHRSLPSMVHIELLLLLLRTLPRAWSTNDAALELRSSPELVAATSDDLVDARLALRDASGAVCFNAENDATMAAVMALQDVYNRRPVTLITALYRRPPSAVQAFSDAFKLR